MAYAEKYNLTFVDLKSVTWRIGILKNGYVGSSSGITGQDSPLSINWHGSKLFEEIRASEATLKLMSTTNFQFSEFFTADATDYILEIKKNGSLFWNGIYIPENYNEPYIDFPYPVTIRFQDGLAYLKKIKYTVPTNVSKQLLITIINNCLAKLPIEIVKDVREVINIFEQFVLLDPTIYGAWRGIYLNPNHFSYLNPETGLMEGMPCYDVIKMIMHDNGCTIYQWNNKWYVFRAEESINSTVNYFVWGSTGSTALSLQKTITNRDQGNPNELIWMYRSAELNITEKFNELIANYKYVWGTKTSLNLLPPMNVSTTDNSTRNHSESWLESTALLAKTTGWYYYEPTTFLPVLNNPYLPESQLNFDILSLGGVHVENNILTSVLDDTLFITALENPSGTVTKKNFPHPITDRIIVMLSYKYTIKIDTLNFNIDAATEIAPYVALVYFKIQLGSYYLKNSTNGGYEWTLTDSIARIDINMNEYEIIQSTLEIMYVNFGLNGTSADFIKLELPVFPIAGNDDLIFKLYCPVLPKILSGANDKITQRVKFEIEYLMLIYKALNIETGIQKITKNLISSTFKNILIIDVLTGDGPHVAATGAYFTNDAETLTANWYNDEDIYTIRSHIESFILRPYSRFFGAYRKKLTGTLYGNIEMFNTLIDNSVIYFINSMNYDVKKNEFEVDLEEIAGVPAGTITEITGMGHVSISGQTNSGKPGKSYIDNPTTMDVSTMTNQTGIISEVAKTPRINDKGTLDKDINDYPL